MKKTIYTSILAIIFSSFALFSASAELIGQPHRIFEIGMDADFAVANGYWGVGDVLKKDLVIDLTKIAKEMPSDGFTLGFFDSEEAFINLNVNSHFMFSVSAGVEASGNMAVEKELFEILGTGIKIGETKSADVTGYGDVFAHISMSYQTLVDDFAVKITPSYVIPVAYIPKTTAKASVSTTSDGYIRAEARAPVAIYTAIDMDSKDFNISEIMNNGGFDLSFEIERNFLAGLNAGVFGRIPVIPGTLTHKMTTEVYAYAEAYNLLGYLDDSESHETKTGHEDFEYSDANYKVYRPFRLGINANYMPFGSWCKIQPMLAVAVRNPYSGNTVVYPEYSLDLRLSLLASIFNFNIGTAYTSQVFQQKIGFGLNLRIFEIIAQTSLCSTSFAKSFNLNGAGTYIGVRIGF